jgi:hypothetical protein
MSTALLAGQPITNCCGGGATTLEWTVSSQQPMHAFEELPRVR